MAHKKRKDLVCPHCFANDWGRPGSPRGTNNHVRCLANPGEHQKLPDGGDCWRCGGCGNVTAPVRKRRTKNRIQLEKLMIARGIDPKQPGALYAFMAHVRANPLT
ncbi:MAG: hypothetical protein ACPHP1_08510 [Miltoncostaeaceae bacterium]